MPSASTLRQTKPGPNGGLTVELDVPVDEFPWLEDDADHGYRVYVNPVPYSVLQIPLGAPAGAETHISVKLGKQVQSRNCAEYNRLSKNSFIYYDPEGYGCAVEAPIKLSRKYFSCEIPLYLFRPNASTVCGPFVYYVASASLAKDHTGDWLGNDVPSSQVALEHVSIV